MDASRLLAQNQDLVTRLNECRGDVWQEKKILLTSAPILSLEKEREWEKMCLEAGELSFTHFQKLSKDDHRPFKVWKRRHHPYPMALSPSLSPRLSPVASSFSTSPAPPSHSGRSPMESLSPVFLPTTSSLSQNNIISSYREPTRKRGKRTLYCQDVDSWPLLIPIDVPSPPTIRKRRMDYKRLFEEVLKTIRKTPSYTTKAYDDAVAAAAATATTAATPTAVAASQPPPTRTLAHQETSPVLIVDDDV